MLNSLQAVLLAAAVVGTAVAGVPAKTKIIEPKTGLSTPGVKLPFTSIKAEAELPAPTKPAWLFVSDSLFVPAGDHVERIDAKTNKPADSLKDLDKPCGGMVSAFGSLWTPLCGKPGLARIDAKTYKVTKTINTGVSAAADVIAASSDSIWILTDGKTTLARIDPEQDAIVGEMRLPAACQDLVFAENALWLSCPRKNRILRINAATNLVEQQINVSAGPQSIAAGEGSIWVLCGQEGKIDRIDPKTNKVVKTVALNVPHAEGMIAFGDGFLWATMTGFPLTRLEIQGDNVTVLQQFYGPGGGAFALAPGAIWLSNLASGTVWRIDPKRVKTILPE